MNIYNLKTIFLGDFHLNDDKNGKYKQGDWKIRKVVEIEKIDKNWVIDGILSNKYKKEKTRKIKSSNKIYKYILSSIQNVFYKNTSTKFEVFFFIIWNLNKHTLGGSCV